MPKVSRLHQSHSQTSFVEACIWKTDWKYHLSTSFNEGLKWTSLIQMETLMGKCIECLENIWKSHRHLGDHQGMQTAWSRLRWMASSQFVYGYTVGPLHSPLDSLWMIEVCFPLFYGNYIHYQLYIGFCTSTILIYNYSYILWMIAKSCSTQRMV